MPDPLFTSGEACLAPTVFNKVLPDMIYEKINNHYDLF